MGNATWPGTRGIGGEEPRHLHLDKERRTVTDHVYKTIEITGSSTEGVTQAIDRAVAKASESVRGIDWFEVTEIRGHVEAGSVAHYQVTIKLGFRLEN